MELVDKDKIVAEIKRRIDDEMEIIKKYTHPFYKTEITRCNARVALLKQLQDFLNTLEVKEVEDNKKTDWHPSNKQIESLHDLLRYNIGVFDYQKFMDVQSLYDDLIKYETNR